MGGKKGNGIMGDLRAMSPCHMGMETAKERRQDITDMYVGPVAGKIKEWSAVVGRQI
ncbi:hypothetical protein OCU04_005003 [Sclerotinia nivalis]|uniref:Uncharacterized protein n=1 Tax=Sclerotinia nivalis TaxID=352851 RepID=A0A9X0AN72_9HELO|nr:hypothetical protein OCU04_005003 [Sclerotinia nivalis]